MEMYYGSNTKWSSTSGIEKQEKVVQSFKNNILERKKLWNNTLQ